MAAAGTGTPAADLEATGFAAFFATAFFDAWCADLVLGFCAVLSAGAIFFIAGFADFLAVFGAAFWEAVSDASFLTGAGLSEAVLEEVGFAAGGLAVCAAVEKAKNDIAKATCVSVLAKILK